MSKKIKRPIVFFVVSILLLIAILAGIDLEHSGFKSGTRAAIGIAEGHESVGPFYYHEIMNKEIKKNDFAFNLLTKNGFSPIQIQPFLSVGTDSFSLKKIIPGDSIRIYKNLFGDLSKIIYQKNPYQATIMEKVGTKRIDVYDWNAPLDKKLEIVNNSIESSLYESLLQTNETPCLAYDLSDIFSWQIDFMTDIRKNDSFACVVEKYYTHDHFVKYGRILFAKFVNDGKAFDAFYYQLPGEEKGRYFDHKGQSTEKSFLKSPLKYNRVSSKFSYNRFHPVLKIYRPHLGVDYAAPTGTPVWAVADGKIIHAGYKGQGGKTVIIKHSGGYQTAYCHLSYIPKNIRRGARVSQKQFIGKVGQTGLATGPHLDYRIKKNGYPMDPLKMDPPSLKNIPDSLMADFKKNANQLIEHYQL